MIVRIFTFREKILEKYVITLLLPFFLCFADKTCGSRGKILRLKLCPDFLRGLCMLFSRDAANFGIQAIDMECPLLTLALSSRLFRSSTVVSSDGGCSRRDVRRSGSRKRNELCAWITGSSLAEFTLKGYRPLDEPMKSKRGVGRNNSGVFLQIAS